jgi:hypothetical protein
MDNHQIEPIAHREVDKTLAEFGSRHPRANLDAIRRVLTDVFGPDLSELWILRAETRVGLELNAYSTNFDVVPRVVIHPTFAIFDPDFAPPGARPDRELYDGYPLRRWEPGRGPQSNHRPVATTLCPECFVSFPGDCCDLCGISKLDSVIPE